MEYDAPFDQLEFMDIIDSEVDAVRAGRTRH